MYDRNMLWLILKGMLDEVYERIALEYEFRTTMPIPVDTVREMFLNGHITGNPYRGVGVAVVDWHLATELIHDDPWVIVHPGEFTQFYNNKAEKPVNRETLRNWLKAYSVGIAMRSPDWENEILEKVKVAKRRPYVIPLEEGA